MFTHGKDDFTIKQWNPYRLALLALALAAASCVDEKTSRTAAAVEESCDTWTVDDPIMIWPPDHAMHPYSLDDCVTVTETECPPPSGYCGDGVVDPGEQCDDGNENPFDGCDTCILVDTTPDLWQPYSSLATGLSITSITSSESTDGTGDGHTMGDTLIVDATTFQLRAERSGNGNDRTYRVNFVDANGETGTCTFFVPHDRGGKCHAQRRNPRGRSDLR
jgi:cysteine-rich repeat protein